jgi:Phosphate acetyl/butaryl transferase
MRKTTRGRFESVTGKLLALDRAFDAYLPPLLSLLDVTSDDPGWERLDPSQRRQRIFEAVRRLLLRETQAQPLLLVFEDLHWVDTETQALLDDPVESMPTALCCCSLCFKDVRVAVLSAVETVNPKLPSTIEAAALCKMADRKQITGAILDGPLALDNAISLESLAIKNIDSAVAGRANVLVVPDLEAGNMLAKSLSFLAGADAAGIVLGARVPVILTSRADSVMTRLASCAVAVLVAEARRAEGTKAVRILAGSSRICRAP